MKKKKLKNLQLNKINISRIDDVEAVKGGDTALICTIPFTITIGSELFCSIIAGGCAPAPAPEPAPGDPDNTRGCPSWNVAC